MDKTNDKIGTLYMIYNDVNNKVYIGKTYSTLEKRWKLHVSDSKKDNKNRPLYNAMKKYGTECFHIKEIGKFKNGDLENMEILYIQKFDSYKNGYNATLGGDGRLYAHELKYVDELFNEEQQKLIIKWFYEYPNVSFISKAIGIDHRKINKVLKKYNIKKLKHEQLKTAENSMRIYQIKDGETINIFYTYEEVRNYLINNKMINEGASIDTIRIGIKGYMSKTYCGYEWKVIHTEDMFKNSIMYEIKNSNVFN